MNFHELQYSSNSAEEAIAAFDNDTVLHYSISTVSETATVSSYHIYRIPQLALLVEAVGHIDGARLVISAQEIHRTGVENLRLR